MSVPPKSVAVPALNLKAQYQTIRDEIEPVVLRVIESQMFVMGPEVEELEAELAAVLRSGRGVGCASGTDALLLPLMAAGDRAGRRGDHDAIHVLRHGRLDLADRCQAGLRRHRARHLQHRPGPDRGGDHAANADDHSGPSLRPDRRHGPDQGDRPQARACSCSKTRPRPSARPTRDDVPAASATRRRSASIRRRTWVASATAA